LLKIVGYDTKKCVKCILTKFEVEKILTPLVYEKNTFYIGANYKDFRRGSRKQSNATTYANCFGR